MIEIREFWKFEILKFDSKSEIRLSKLFAIDTWPLPPYLYLSFSVRLFFHQKELPVIYLQFSRYCASVAELLRHTENEIGSFLEKCDAIATDIRRRLGVAKDARIPWATQLNTEELAQLGRLCNWVDSILGYGLCRQPQASVLSVSAMLATLLRKMCNEYNRINSFHIQLMSTIFNLNAKLRDSYKTSLETTDLAALFPLNLDERLAQIIDDLHSIGIQLGG